MGEFTLPIVLQLLQTAGILVGIIYYITIMRNQQRTRELALQAQEQTLKAQELALETRQAQLFMNIYSQFSSPHFNDAWVRFDTTREAIDTFNALDVWWNEPEMYKSCQILSTYYEGVGVLVKENLIDMRLVAELMTGPIVRFWEFFAPLIDEARERYEYPRMMSETEYLYNELQTYLAEHPELKT